MNDHELDDQIRRLAESYNEPPATPRDAMWARVEQTRAGSTLAIAGHARRMYWLRMGAGIAAVLVVGIGIGRLTHDVGSTAAGSFASSTRAPDGDIAAGQRVTVLAKADAGEESAPSDTFAASTADESSTAAGSGRATDLGAMNRVRATREERIAALSAQRRADARALAAYGVQRSVPATAGEGGGMSSYQLAVVEHMARSEVLLTSFLAASRTSPNSERTLAQFAALSRDLLKTTRLLLATRTADDPGLTRLLEDLELVLMQISQYTAEGRRGDLDAINQSLDRRNVLPKLRSTIPAGASASTGI
jgi:hypothetical protein